MNGIGIREQGGMKAHRIPTVFRSVSDFLHGQFDDETALRRSLGAPKGAAMGAKPSLLRSSRILVQALCKPHASAPHRIVLDSLTSLLGLEHVVFGR